MRVNSKCCAVLLLTTCGANAQAPADGSTNDRTASSEVIEEIQVTGSRLGVQGYQQPTPVTTINAEKLQSDAHMDLPAVISQLPSVGPMQSPNSGLGTQSISAGTGGMAIPNLRNLGTGRTLTLFDGVRVAPSSENGGVDLNLLPSSVLVSRIDVVTGGASAAWGSDAVSGVINVVLNRDFQGFAGNFEGAFNAEGTRQSGKVELSYGTDITDRAHLILSGSYYNSPDVVIPTETSWFESQVLMPNPAYTETNDEPRLIHAENVGMSRATTGGLIFSGPLSGTQFLEHGLPAPFHFGTVSGVRSMGGTFANPVYNNQAQNLTVPIESTQLFGHFSYDLANDITATLTLNYAVSDTANAGPSYTRNVTIPIDNAYLDPSIVARMEDAGITSFELGTTNANNVNIRAGDDPIDFGLGNWTNKIERTLFRQVAGLEGSFGEWDWDVALQNSQIERFTRNTANPIVANYNLAVDAVRVTDANVGTSGLPIGSVACRSTLTNPDNGCIPLNVMGIGVASKNAIDYVHGSGAWGKVLFSQKTASAVIRGEPFSNWAGPVSVAAGLDYRWEEYEQTADELSYARAYSIGNFQPVVASQNNKEAFGEINIPLVRDAVVQSLDFNAAVRYTDYSSSGEVTTWKVGATSQVTEDIRLRATSSRDIRAPTLLGLYNPGSSQVQIVLDPFRNNAPTNINTFIRGNPNLQPEIGETFTAGIVLTPRFIPGLSASIDYYRIDISDAFTQPIADVILRECVAGRQTFCDLLQRDQNGILVSLNVSPVNAAFEKTEGFDFQLDYTRDAFDGQLSFSALGNMTTKLSSEELGRVRNPLNSLNRAEEGPPKFRGMFGLGYTTDRFDVGAQVRAIGSGYLNRQWGPKDVDDNDVPAVAFVDLRGSYFFGDDNRFQAYIAVDNVLDKDPPIISNDAAVAFSYFFAPTRTELYDSLGTQFRVGFRTRF
jgi:iron complex outermembrane recepter protein